MGRRLRDFFTWLASAVVATALLVGAPLLLIAAGDGWPGPTNIPTIDEVGEFFTDRLSDNNVIAVFVIVGWLLWAHFVWVFLIEFFNQVRDRESKELHTAAITQRMARMVVAGLFRLGATSTAVLGVIGPAGTAGAVVAMASHAGASELPDGVFVETDSIPGGFDVDDGSTIVLTDPDVSPRDGRIPYLVQEDDTLWDISERHTGDPQRWREVFDASQGFTQPGADDRVLAEPRLINPGMVLLLPGDAVGAPEVEESLVEAVYGPLSGVEDVFVEPSEAGDFADSEPEPEPEIEPAVVVAETPMPEPVVDPVGVDVPDAELDVSAAEIDGVLPAGIGMNGTTAVVGFGAGGVLFATFMAMRLKKTKRWARSVRHPGEAPATPDIDSNELEQEVMAASDFEQADFYGRAWRSLASRPMETDDTCQPLLAIRHHGELQVLMSEPRQDAPFPWTCKTVEMDRAVWTIPIDEGTMEQLPDDRIAGALPLMVTIGENVFVNLESIGPLGIAGDQARTAGLTRALMWELAISPWIDGIDIRITEAAAEQLHLEAGEDAVTINQEVTASAVLAVTTLDSHRISNIHVARAVLHADHFPSLVIGDASDVDALDGVLRAAREQRAPVGVIMLDDRSNTYIADVEESGNMVLSPSGLRMRAAFAEVDRGEMFARLQQQRSRLVTIDGSEVVRDVPSIVSDDFDRVAATDSSVESVAPVVESATADWPYSSTVLSTEVADPAGVVEVGLDVVGEDPNHFDSEYEAVQSPSVDASSEFPSPPVVNGTEPPQVGSYDGVPVVTNVDAGDAAHHVPTVDDFTTEPTQPVAEGERVLTGDDSVLAESNDDDAIVDLREHALDENLLTIEILGTPAIRGNLKDKPKQAPLSLITFLAVEGDQSRQGVQSAMWGAGTDVSQNTFGSFVRRARSCVHTENFPAASDGRYRVANVVTDFELLLQRMRLADRLENDHERLTGMLDALTLIKGMPFGSDDLSAHWNWIDSLSTQPRIVVEAAVSEAVERTVLAAIELERFDDALVAIRRGLLANPYSEWLVLTQVKILAETDHRKAAKEVVEEYEAKFAEEFGADASKEPRKLLTSFKAAS